jgi:predicted phage terminase large subunit-like protein
MPTLRLRRLHAAQRRIKREARRFNVIDCGRQFGKSTLAIDLAIEGALRGWPVGYFSPTYKMQTEIWREVDQTTRPIQRERSAQERRLELATGGVIDFWSLDSPNSARGRRYRRVLVDEAAMIPDLEDVWNAVLRATLLRYQGDAWFKSTPRGFNYFHALWRRGDDADYPDWMSWQMPSSENPYLSPEDIEQARRELPDSTFRQEYLAMFEDDAPAIFSPSWWADGRARYDGAPWPASRAWGRYISLDTAFKETKTAAYSAAVVGEFSHFPDMRLAIIDAWRDRVAFPDLVTQTERLIRQFDADGKLNGVLIEDRASGISLVQTLRSSLPPGMADLIVPVPIPYGQNKGARAALASVPCRDGRVLLPIAAHWLKAFEAELYAAPHGEYWDWIDSFSQLVLWTEHLLAAGGQAA